MLAVDFEVETTNSLKEFLEEWDKNYKARASQIDLFKSELTSQWSMAQKQLFVTTLYHQRSHFDDVLWYLGNFAPSIKEKELVLSNFREEFGGRGKSHELLYQEFAKSMELDLIFELIDEKYYLPFLREYNYGHLNWLRKHDWTHNLALFAALERLDNIDYANLRRVAVSIDTQPRYLGFFDVHMHVTHYDEIEKSSFFELWLTESAIIKKVFAFVNDYQLAIWKRISDEVFNYTGNKQSTIYYPKI